MRSSVYRSRRDRVLLGAAGVSAQTYPTKPVSVIVPFAAGGATDTLMRFSARGCASARPADHRRERRRRGGHHRRRPRGAVARRRLHDERRHLDHHMLTGASTRCSSI